MEKSFLEHFKDLKYNKGFCNTFETEALAGAVPQNQNSPQKLKYGLFPEQLNGTAFTVKRASNQKSWLYKLRPSAIEGQYTKAPTLNTRIISSYNRDDHNIHITPNQLRWRPIPDVKEGDKKHFVEGLVSLLGAGDPSMKDGLSIYAYSANKSMEKTAFYNSDGDFLIVPQTGTLYITTTFGKLTVSPKQICIIQRGIKFTVEVEGQVKGWIAENFKGHLEIPELGPIGSNGMAHPKDFYYPVAYFEDSNTEWRIINKYIGELYTCKTDFSPYDVVGWRGNYAPYKYNLELYNTIGSISYDHPDPSIFTVLTCSSGMEGTALLDFVVFPPRWLVAENTFKPPYYHRNCMSEFMGNISGTYDAKQKGFVSGAASLHSIMTPHGPDAEVYEKAAKSELKPFKTDNNSYAFMFESCYMLKTTRFAFDDFLQVDHEYHKCWENLKNIKVSADQK